MPLALALEKIPAEQGQGLLQEVEQLKRNLLPILHQLETLQESTFGPERDLTSIQLLVRRTKDQLAE